jgi:hypothetical protein
MSTLKEAFDNMIEEQVEIKNKFQKTAQELFKEITKEFFAKNPAINAVIWTQYTPYFNDGEACLFNVNQPSFTNASGEELDDVNYGEYEGDDENIWVFEDLEWSMKKHKEKYDPIIASGGIDIDSCKFLHCVIKSSEMEDIMETMFGEHSRVVATREGFDVEEYEHD